MTTYLEKAGRDPTEECVATQRYEVFCAIVSDGGVRVILAEDNVQINYKSDILSVVTMYDALRRCLIEIARAVGIMTTGGFTLVPVFGDFCGYFQLEANFQVTHEFMRELEYRLGSYLPIRPRTYYSVGTWRPIVLVRSNAYDFTCAVVHLSNAGHNCVGIVAVTAPGSESRSA